MKLSGHGHTSLRSLAKYARVSDEGLLNSQAELLEQKIGGFQAPK
ncbi:hypothetical protein AB0D71_38710 [Streptomyces avermitilis]